MTKFQLLPELRVRKHKKKVFLYNPWNDDLLEMSKLSWEVALNLCEGKKLNELAHKLAERKEKVFKKIFKEIKELKKELIKWGIILVKETNFRN